MIPHHRKFSVFPLQLHLAPPPFTNFPIADDYIIFYIIFVHFTSNFSSPPSSTVGHLYLPLIIMSSCPIHHKLPSAFLHWWPSETSFHFIIFGTELDSHSSWPILWPYLMADCPSSFFLLSHPAWFSFRTCLCLEELPYDWFLLIRKGWTKCHLFKQASLTPRWKCHPSLIPVTLPVNLYTPEHATLPVYIEQQSFNEFSFDWYHSPSFQ